mmetsp:Transcript_7027/g.17369  ORF Transcript_7027/g.17369 Transcript_7027/m.17369 type:complete len:421 (-) Transcript_7027:291-1553(-)
MHLIQLGHSQLEPELHYAPEPGEKTGGPQCPELIRQQHSLYQKIGPVPHLHQGRRALGRAGLVQPDVGLLQRVLPQVVPAQAAVLRLDLVEDLVPREVRLTPDMAEIPVRGAEPRVPVALHLFESRRSQQQPVPPGGTDSGRGVENLQELPVLGVLHGDTSDCAGHEVEEELGAGGLVVPHSCQPLFLLRAGAVNLPTPVERYLTAGQLLDLPVLHPPWKRVLVVHGGEEPLHGEVASHARGNDGGEPVPGLEADAGAREDEVDGAPPGVAHGRHVERGEPVHVRCVGVRAGLQQLLTDFVAAVLHRPMQGRPPAVISVLQRRAPLQEQLHDRQLACRGGQVEQGTPTLIELVKVARGRAGVIGRYCVGTPAIPRQFRNSVKVPTCQRCLQDPKMRSRGIPKSRRARARTDRPRQVMDCC